MNKKKHQTAAVRPAPGNVNVLGQLLKLVQRSVVESLAAVHGVQAQARTFSPWSHLAAMMHAQLTHALSLNDVCDSMRLKEPALRGLGITPPSRNNLSHANMVRRADFVEAVFWKTLQRLQQCEPRFAAQGRGQGPLRRFKVRVQAVDSTVLELVANCMGWAQHRRRKAAAKMHLRLDLHNFLPAFALVDRAKDGDCTRAPEVCAGLKQGEVAVFDKGYVDFPHLQQLDARGVQWVTRAKSNLLWRARRNRPLPPHDAAIVKDQEIALTGPTVRGLGLRLRRIAAWVEIDGRTQLMVFLTNNLAWSARTVADLYRCRWGIEVFFKQLKQTLKIGDFLGYSANAVRWQVWTALLVYVLLRFMAWLSQWPHALVRLFALVRTALWERIDLPGLLHCYGTAPGRLHLTGSFHTAWLPGLAPPSG